jgi:hypothetical protein
MWEMLRPRSFEVMIPFEYVNLPLGINHSDVWLTSILRNKLLAARVKSQLAEKFRSLVAGTD